MAGIGVFSVRLWENAGDALDLAGFAGLLVVAEDWDAADFVFETIITGTR